MSSKVPQGIEHDASIESLGIEISAQREMENISPPHCIYKWQSDALESHPEPPPELPRVTLADFDPADRRVIEEHYGTRDWEWCEALNCGRIGTQYKMRKCAGCCFFDGPTVYCSRACQRASWPAHKETCLRDPLMEYSELIRMGCDPYLWKHNSRRGQKRRQGLILAADWLFKCVYAAHPGFDLEKVALSVYCRSTKGGKGRMTVTAYRLEVIAKTPHKERVAEIRAESPDKTMGVVQLWVDTIYHEPICVNMDDSPQLFPLTAKKWPWVFASVVFMNNYNAKLGRYRMEILLFVVEVLLKAKMPQLDKFIGPSDLELVGRWELSNLDAWQGIFGRLIGF